MTGRAAAFLLSAAIASMALPAAAQDGSWRLPEASATASQGAGSFGRAATLSPEAAALRSALSRTLGRDHPGLVAYADRDFRPIWLDGQGGATDAARALVDVLRDAGDHALPAAKYGGDTLSVRLSGPDSGAAALEADLTAAFLAYATDVGSGLLEPGRIDREIHLTPQRPDPATLIRGAASARNMAAFLDGLAPDDPAYRRLVERYRVFRSVAAREIWGPPVRPGRTITPGDRGRRVAEARARLTAMGDLDPNIYDMQATTDRDGTLVAVANVTTDVPMRPFDPALFDQPMVEALKRFQDRHGLNRDGLIGPATRRQLNVSPATRAEQIAVNLERLRWLNQNLGERHVLVNLAGFEVTVVNRGDVEFRSRAVVGKADRHRTPEFSDVMSHIVVNPSWHVPGSIAREEILPELKRDPAYLSRRNMRLVGAGATAQEINWSTVTPGTFPGRVTQRPGPGNALGTVKFMFPNDFAIYLHDTPSKQLFARDVRDFSHGCIRVEKPHELAEYLLTGQETNPGEYFRSVLDRGRERRIDLTDPLPVHITYRSAWIDDRGVEQFRGDIYGRDRRIAEALRTKGVRTVE